MLFYYGILGIIINKHINWTSHTELTANKITKYVGVTNRLKHILPLHILHNLYNTFILPHVYYGILLWGHDNTRRHRLQKQAERTIIISKYNAHTKPLCKALNIIKFPDMYNPQLYK